MPESLSPQEKRKLFRQRYGELLIPHGFFFKGRNYYRLSMQEQIVLVVSIYYGQSGHQCSLRIAALPFALGLSPDNFFEGNIHIDGDLLLNRDKNTIRIYPFDEKFEAVYQEFTHNYLERFLSVHDLQSWDAFEVWVNGGKFEPYDIRRPWPCIILGRWDQAAFHVRHRIIWLQQCLDGEQKRLAQAEEDASKFEEESHADMHPSSLAARRRELAYKSQFLRDEVMRTAKMVAERNQFLSLLEPPQTDYFVEQVQNAVLESIEACHSFFGKIAR